jgi:hypothetical protein
MRDLNDWAFDNERECLVCGRQGLPWNQSRRLLRKNRWITECKNCRSFKAELIVSNHSQQYWLWLELGKHKLLYGISGMINPKGKSNWLVRDYGETVRGS